MPKPIQKTLQDYLTKLKKPKNTLNLNLSSKPFSSSTSWILRGCKHPKTPSLTVHCKQNDDAATLSDVDRFLFENFKSLYNENDDQNKDKKGDGDDNDEEKSSSGSIESPEFIDPQTNNIGWSHHIFLITGTSNSPIGESMTSTAVSEEMGSSSSSPTTITTTTRTTTRASDDAKEVMGADDFIAVLTYSPSPHDDFRRSMQEMIEARLHHNGKADWEFMEELLFCYLNLNDKKSYKYILSAFVDLTVVLRENHGRLPTRSRSVLSEDERRKKREM